MASIAVKYSKDGLKGFVAVSMATQDSYPSVAQMRTALSENGIVYGIDTNALQRMVDAQSANTFTQVAQGTAPSAPVHGRRELLVDMSEKGRPKQLDNGRVDHRQLQKVINVKQGTPLLQRIPPKRGKDGTNIFGNRIKAMAPRDVTLPVGKGVQQSPDDENMLIAATDGDVYIYDDYTVEVRKEKRISGDVDYATGNIDFFGDIDIGGNVRSGFEVKAAGSVVIAGCVEDARVYGGGEVHVAGGATGARQGMIEAHGDIRMHYCEHFSLKTMGDLHIEKHLIHCACTAGGVIHADRIVGGHLSAHRGVVARQIGAPAETGTEIFIGVPRQLEQKQYALLKKLTALNTEQVSYKQQLFDIVNENVDDNGFLDEDHCTQLSTCRQRLKALCDQQAQLQQHIHTLQQQLHSEETPFVKARTVYPNTTIRCADDEKRITHEMTHTLITLENGALRVSPL
jgi:hypothetical protein